MPILNVNQKRVAKPKPGIGDASDYTEMVLRNAQVSVQPLGAKRLSPTGNFLKFVPFWPAKKMYEEKLEYLNTIDIPPVVPYIPVWTTYGGCWILTTNPPDESTSAIQTCDASLSQGYIYAVLSQSFRGTCEFTMNVHEDTDIGFMSNVTTREGFRIRPYVLDGSAEGRVNGQLLIYHDGLQYLPGSPIQPSGEGWSQYLTGVPNSPGFDATGIPRFDQNSDRVRIEITTSDTPVNYWDRNHIRSSYPTGVPGFTTTDIVKVSIVSGAVDGTGKYIGGGTVRHFTDIPISPGSLTDGGLFLYVRSARTDLDSGVGLKPDEFKDFIFT